MTQFTDYERVYENHSSASSITAPSPTTTKPSTGVFSPFLPYRGEAGISNFIRFLLFGTDAANEDGVCNVYGWNKIGSLWIPTLLADLSATLGAATGVAGQLIADTDLIADTIAIDSGTSLAIDSIDIISPADDTVGYVDLDVRGSELVQFLLSTEGSAAGLNVLCRKWS